jgi:hypothetical protein
MDQLQVPQRRGESMNMAEEAPPPAAAVASAPVAATAAGLAEASNS